MIKKVLCGIMLVLAVVCGWVLTTVCGWIICEKIIKIF